MIRNKFEECTLKEGSINFIKIGINCAIKFRNCLSQIIFEDYYDNRSNPNYYNIPIDKLIRFREEISINVIELFLNKYTSTPLKYCKLFSSLYSCEICNIKYLFYIDEINNLTSQFSW